MYRNKRKDVHAHVNKQKKSYTKRWFELSWVGRCGFQRETRCERVKRSRLSVVGRWWKEDVLLQAVCWGKGHGPSEGERPSSVCSCGTFASEFHLCDPYVSCRCFCVCTFHFFFVGVCLCCFLFFRFRCRSMCCVSAVCVHNNIVCVHVKHNQYITQIYIANC